MNPARLAALMTLLATPAAAQKPPAVNACDLLTAKEVETAVGWALSSAPEAKTYGPTSTCQFTGNALKHQTVIVLVSRPVPKVTTSAAMAAWRTEQGKRTPELAVTAKPVEGLGAPAIRTDDGSGPPTVEAAVDGRLLGVTAPTFETAQALVAKAIPRLR